MRRVLAGGAKARGLDHGNVDGIILSHLHGDHFGALPFLLLDAQLVTRRERPLTIAGPPGSRARIEAALEMFFPRALTNRWRFPFEIVEIEPGRPAEILGHAVSTAEVVHQSGAPSTALRISDGERLFAYSGDTEWTDALIGVADGADLFIVECYGYAGVLQGPPELGNPQAQAAEPARQADHAHAHESLDAGEGRGGEGGGTADRRGWNGGGDLAKARS